MPTLEEEEAFSHLRARQGSGARYDAEGAPELQLSWARRGTAYFARLLNSLYDHELFQPSLVADWPRAHIVAAVAFNARDITHMVEAARLGSSQVSLPAPSDRQDEIALAATLPAHALRNLFKHSEVHLNVEWRDLTTENWATSFKTERDSAVAVSNTPFMRADYIWRRAIDLDAGGDADDIPFGLLERLELL